MATVISSDRLTKHSVDKYTFKVLPMGTDNAQETEKPVLTKDNNPGIRAADIDSSAMSQNSKDSLIESLMKKTDEMSSNFIKLQMKLEDMSEEHTHELEKVKTESFNEGIIAGKDQAAKGEVTSMNNAIVQLSASISTLDNCAADYERALEGIKSELISAALDISKEVIKIELNESSTAIAEVLSKELIKELQSASKITLKVNPRNHGDISQKLGSLKHVEIISDSAVSEGGVIAISDAGNIDAQISKRFERVKRAALSE
ncbi:flagellar assembly protein [Sulfurimonas gotlandica GD1]|uniref:Flagellar assembly protein FliH n=1 Tax=Sulfurimonas gotlandica (strain DSM 19862 / JCM 16533 / GD1) TaxID=929558 RepID=B6BMF1_SULGG|nr:flagellar assembly protein FliH [Sulfurimonas gotlandica]EDZ61932.1 flagellar assembly protein [Sulfurimonas gotlandica GD1]EHP29271.1 flagellar assembly protein [Sulfurimonas gotlandica GD1]